MEQYDFQDNIKIDPIEEANRRYIEKIKVQRPIPVYDSRKLELLTQMNNQIDSALNACGFDFIRKICSIDQELAHNILSIFSQAVEKNNFDDVEMSFRRIIAKKLDEEEKNSYKHK